MGFQRASFEPQSILFSTSQIKLSIAKSLHPTAGNIFFGFWWELLASLFKIHHIGVRWGVAFLSLNRGLVRAGICPNSFARADLRACPVGQTKNLVQVDEMSYRAVAVFQAFFVVTIVCSSVTLAQSLQENERIIFFGDSITREGDQPGGYVSLVGQAIRKALPENNVEVIGSGVGGNQVPDLLARLDRDVLSKDPTTVVIYIGINDVWHSTNNNGTTKDDYETGLRDLVDQIRKAKARVILCTPSVIGEKTDGSNQLDPMLGEYVDISRRVASVKNVEMLDLRAAFLGELKRLNPENREEGVLTRDGVHLNQLGNRFVAERMLSAAQVNEMENQRQGRIRHIVMFKFKEGLDPGKIDEIVAAFAELPNQIEEIVEFEMGTNISPENLEQGYSHCFVVTFQNEADRDRYLPHPAHKKFVEVLDGRVDKVLVFDYQTNE